MSVATQFSSRKRKKCIHCGRMFIHKRNKTCSRQCNEMSQLKQADNRVKHFNSFLPPDAEENIAGIWVPSPQEIEQAKQEIQEHHRQLLTPL